MESVSRNYFALFKKRTLMVFNIKSLGINLPISILITILKAKKTQRKSSGEANTTQ